jgi:hypothetical protein
MEEVFRFIKKILLFLPLAVIFGFPLLLLNSLGEMLSVPQILQKQANPNTPVLIGRAFENDGPDYKLQAVMKFRPEIITLGDSRCNTIRSDFFTKDARFFNACSSIQVMDDFNKFLDLIPPGHEPKFIIMCLDERYFNSALDFDRSDFTQIKGNTLPYKVRMIWRDYKDKKFTFKQLLNYYFSPSRNNFIGLSAIITHNGVRNDGSTYYGQEVENLNDPEYVDRFKGLYSSILNGNGFYKFCDDLDPKIVSSLIEFLTKCRSRNIYVVGYMPPYIHSEMELLKYMGGKEAYLFKARFLVPVIFNKFGFDFFDFSDLSQLGASDEEMIDSQHVGEKASLRLFITMALQNKKLLSYSNDSKFLIEKLFASRNPLAVFKENF